MAGIKVDVLEFAEKKGSPSPLEGLLPLFKKLKYLGFPLDILDPGVGSKYAWPRRRSYFRMVTLIFGQFAALLILAVIANIMGKDLAQALDQKSNTKVIHLVAIILFEIILVSLGFVP